MVGSRQPKAGGISTDEKSGVDEKRVWYKTKTGWAVPGGVFWLVLLNWGVRVKPQWIRISIANINVAILAAIFAYIFLRVLQTKSTGAKMIFGALWLLLLPNAAYLFTDLGHLVYQWNQILSVGGRILLLLQYLLLEGFGVILFLFTFSPFEKIIERVKVFKERKVPWLILFNFLIAFGVVLGRYEHINSYVVFTEPRKVLEAVSNIFGSMNLFGLTILFGLLCNLVYFLFRGLLLQRAKPLEENSAS